MNDDSRDPPSADPWRSVAETRSLPPGRMRTWKQDHHQLVVGRADTGEYFALDNRCPHEGYPLAQGELSGQTLTCSWHNWKFGVTDGSCVLGGEAVRAYPVRVRGGHVEVNLAPPDPAEEKARLRASLREGLGRHDNGRCIRDGVRWIVAGFSAIELLAEIAAYDAEHAEYGTTHTLPVAADLVRFLPALPGAQAMHAVAMAMDLCGDSNAYLPARPSPDARIGAGPGALRAAVEAEATDTAEAWLKQALQDQPRSQVERALFEVLSDHFTDFGHPLIYLVKAQELIAAAGDDYAARLYPALLHGQLVATREDTLPYFRPYRDYLQSLANDLPELFRRARGDRSFDPRPLRDAAIDGSARDALDLLHRSLEDGASPVQVAEALVLAGARRLLRFQASLDSDPGVAENWLWATHRFTFASAVRLAVTRFREPDSLRFLFQALGFIHSGAPMDAELHLPPAAAGGPDELIDALQRRDPGRALALGQAWLARGGLAEIAPAIDRFVLGDHWVRPIIHAHALKVWVAAQEETAALAHAPEHGEILLAALRFMASPVVERRIQATVRASIDWVVHGKMPRKLTQ